MESILTSIKKLLGIVEADTSFDVDIIIYINAAFAVLTQLGVGPIGFSITDKNDSWSDFMGDDTRYELAKSYVFLKVKTIFDPPASSTVAEAYKQMISEYEFRLKTASETPII